MALLTTKDYTIFKKVSENRKLNEFNIKQLMNSLATKNNLHLKPIIVDKNLCVMDGQHRLEAARRLHIEVVYEIDENAEAEDIILYNANQKSWKIAEYMNFFCEKEYKEYLSLRKFCEDNNVSIMQFRALMGSGEDFTERFRKGKFVFPAQDKMEKLTEKMTTLKFVQEYIETKLPNSKVCYKGSIFIHALLDFFNIKRMDISTFIEKLEYKVDMLRPCTSRQGYMSMFKEIYNWKNVNKIEF